MYENFRKHKRYHTQQVFRIYSSLINCKYSVGLRNLSKKGAFIATNKIPPIGETISFCYVDEFDRDHFIGCAKVVRHASLAKDGEDGFGVEFDGEIPESYILIEDNEHN